ncbi:MAG: hypothetical protein JEZ03_01060 [Bacteroidales bacterium]|nr:hypothetical protein [Bacteroidales bacterium]
MLILLVGTEFNHGIARNQDSFTQTVIKTNAIPQDSNSTSTFPEIDWLISQGQEYLQSEDPYQAQEYFNNALSLALRESYSVGVIDARLGLGRVYSLGHYDMAIESVFQALRLAEEIEDYYRIYNAYMSLGGYHFNYGNVNKALEYFQFAEQVRPKIKDSVDMALVYHNDALRNMYEQNYADAIHNFNISIKLMEQKNQYKRSILTLNHLGNVYQRLNLPDSIVIILNRAYRLADSIGFENGKLGSCINLGFTYTMLNQSEKAIDYFFQGLALAKKLESNRGIRNTYMGLYQVFKQKGDFENALGYFENYKNYNDSVVNMDIQQRISLYESKYKQDKNQKEIDVLEARNQSQRRLVIILIITIFSGMMIGALSIYLYRLKSKNLEKENVILAKEKELKDLTIEKTEAENKKRELENAKLAEELAAQEEISRLKEEKYKAEIDHKNKELSTSVLHIASKNEFLLGIKEEMLRIMKNLPSDSQSFMKQVLKDIDNGLNVDREWGKFKKHFEEVHEGFFQHLIETSPDLTHNELRLCAYLLINLSSKEISSMLNISPAAVEKRRQRLRKKLNLDPSENLVEYLNRY